MSLIRIVPALLGILFATAVARDGFCDSAGLWVTLASGDHAYKVAADDAEAQTYVRAFVAGHAPVAIPPAVRERWLTALGLAPGEKLELHVTAATECREDGSCVRLHGLYAGRSPDT